MKAVYKLFVTVDATALRVSILTVFAPGTLGNQPDSYLVTVNYNVALGVWHINAYYIYQ